MDGEKDGEGTEEKDVEETDEEDGEGTDEKDVEETDELRDG